MEDDKKPKRFDPDAIEVPAQVEADFSDGQSSTSHGGEASDGVDRASHDNSRAGSVRGGSDVGQDFTDLSWLGSDLARMMQDGGYHPVVLFGTNNSGKTSILMSLFATIASEPILDTGLALCDPILGTRTEVGRQLHREAEHTFHIKTQAFIRGEKIPKTSTPLPFFIPVEFRPPDGRPPVKLAFLESNGEWYRPLISDGRKLSDVDKLYPDLRGEIESFISSFQNGITFLYTAPVTQGEVYAAGENAFDSEEIGYASLAIRGVLQTYDRIRANGRSQDKHLLLLTKWDALSVRSPDRADAISATPEEVIDFCQKRYQQALTAFQGLNLGANQRNINAYCAGMINERGLLPLKTDDPVRGVIATYPVRLWTYLYQNALAASDLEPVPPFRQPPRRPPVVEFFTKLLDRISG
jgi:hypothetical protein